MDPKYHLCAVLQSSAHMPFLTEGEELSKLIRIFINNTN